MKQNFFDGCKVKIQNYDRGYDGRICILETFGPKKNKEWKVVLNGLLEAWLAMLLYQKSICSLYNSSCCLQCDV